MAELGLRRGLVPTRDEIRRLGRMLDVDVIVTGEVVSYFEEIVQDPPYIAKLSEDRTKAEWEVKQRTHVVLNLPAGYWIRVVGISSTAGGCR